MATGSGGPGALGRSCPVVQGRVSRLVYWDTDPPAMQCGRRRCGRRLPGSTPSFTTGSQIHFYLCHLPSHLKGSYDGFIRFLNSFHLSLITLQISKSSQARADRERNEPSSMWSWGSLPHLQSSNQRPVQVGTMPRYVGPRDLSVPELVLHVCSSLVPVSGNTTRLEEFRHLVFDRRL